MAGEGDEDDDAREFWFRHSESAFFLDTLEKDVERAEELLAAQPGDAFMRRTLVRTMFAEVEGLSASAIDWAGYYAAETSALKGRYTEAERIVLCAQTAQVNDRGKAVIQGGRSYLPTKKALRFALSLVGRGAAEPAVADYQDGGWSALVAGLAVRDRLMHPKAAADLEVSEPELEQVRRGRAWFVATYRASESALQKTLAADLGRKMAAWQLLRGEQG